MLDMEREEAIEHLQRAQSILSNDPYTQAISTACNVAIEALKKEPCEDCVSREAAIYACKNGWNKGFDEIMEDIKQLPHVKPDQKIGRWTTQDTVLGKCCVCSECGGCPNIEYRYCPYCGAKMEEVEE